MIPNYSNSLSIWFNSTKMEQLLFNIFVVSFVRFKACVFFVEFVAFYQNYIFAQFFFLLLFPLLSCCIESSPSSKDRFTWIENINAICQITQIKNFILNVNQSFENILIAQLSVEGNCVLFYISKLVSIVFVFWIHVTTSGL